MPGVSMPTSRWDDPRQAAIYREDVAAGSRILRVQGAAIKTYRFDPKRYPLAQLATGLLVEKGFLSRADADRLGDLTQLHRFVPREATVLDSAETNAVSRAFF